MVITIIFSYYKPINWLVQSSRVYGEFYTVSEKFECTSDCALMCKLCKKCFHNYECSCIDNSIRSNMCKHIHLVCTYINNKSKDSEANSFSANNDKSNNLIIDDKSPDHELQWHINDFKSKSKNGYFFLFKKKAEINCSFRCLC